MIAQLYLLITIIRLQLFIVNSQRVQTCTGNNLRFPTPSIGRCISSFANSRLETKSYPDDFNGITNQVQIYKCTTSNKRIIISNGIPNHDVTLQNRIAPCEVNWVVEIPLNPSVSNQKTEIPMRGMIAMVSLYTLSNLVRNYGTDTYSHLSVIGPKRSTSLWTTGG